MIGLLQRSADFERVLRTRSRASSPHFAVHHLIDVPAVRTPRPPATPLPRDAELSTVLAPVRVAAVEDSVEAVVPPAVSVWFGSVLPKRHARRAVTRTLLKRQIRSVVTDRAGTFPGGLWVVRLRAPFDRSVFVSAASDALRCEARAELQQVLASAAERSKVR